jgi:hypothetical protein
MTIGTVAVQHHAATITRLESSPSEAAMHRTALALVIGLTPTLACADALGELRQVLVAFAATESVEAAVSMTFEQTNADEDAPKVPPATVAVAVTANADGVSVRMPRTLLDTAAEEARNTDAEATTPVRSAIGQVDLVQIDEYMNAVPALLATLAEAKVSSDTNTTWQGQPARLLTLEIQPQLNARQRKFIKKLDSRAKLWLAADGTPLAAEQSTDVGGRAFLVVSFESSSSDRYEFARRGDRLIVTRHSRQTTGSGAGESSAQSVEATVTLAPPEPET